MSLRYLDDGLFRGITKEVLSRYMRERESALRKGRCFKLEPVESAKELGGIRMGRLEEQKQRSTSYKMQEHVRGEGKKV